MPMGEGMTQQTERDALRKLAEAATPGPWAFGTFHRLLVVQADKHGYADKHSAIADIGAGSIPWDETAESMQEYNDAEYIAAANPAAVITLLDQLQSQAERIKVIERESEMRRIALHDVMLESAQLRAQLAAMTANAATDRHLMDLTNDTATRLLKERDTLRAELANAAIQHYLDQHKAELPVLPDHPEPRTMKWSALEIEAIQAYGLQCAAHAREMALNEAVEQVTTLYEGDEAPYLIDICKAIEALKGK